MLPGIRLDTKPQRSLRVGEPASLSPARTTSQPWRIPFREDLHSIGAEENQVTAHWLDLCDVDSVNGFATWYGQNHGGRLHVLINNAGIHRNILSPRKKPPLSQDGFEVHWRTNYLGAFHLTSVLLPLLQRSGLECGDARVINVSSHLHDRVKNEGLFSAPDRYHSWDAYGLAKLALIHFSFEIQRRFADRYNLRSAALHPGSVAHQPHADGGPWREDWRRLPPGRLRPRIVGTAAP